MMSHMASTEVLTSEALKLRDHGAGGFVFMDSAGVFRPEDVAVRVRSLRDSLGPTYPIGFHAHNNLGYGLTNSISAISNGADSIDASAAGLGAGAGNLNLELWGVWLQDQGHLDESESDIFISMAELIEDLFTPNLPRISSQSVRSGLAGAFSGYSPQVAMASQSHGVSTQAIWREIGARGLVAGQESAIWEIAQDLSNL
jgi:4-hydroxy 2-oxovalerate aldolase